MPQMSGPNLQENHIIETWKEEGCAVSTQETAAVREWEDGTFGTLTAPWIDSRPHPRIANQLAGSNKKAITSIGKNCSLSTTQRGGCHSTLLKNCHDEGASCYVAFSSKVTNQQ
jgi:hypothetical protein